MARPWPSMETSRKCVASGKAVISCVATYASLVCCFLCTCVTGADAGIAGSGHDLSGKGWGTNEICIFCHTPHNADRTISGAPLWNHQVTTATFTLYGSPSLKKAPEQPGGVSRLCLSCHDGTVAVDNFGGRTGGSHFVSTQNNLTTNLSDDHPVSILWDHQTQQTACVNCHNFRSSAPRVIPFFDGRVECASCHEPHNKAADVNMLRKSLSKSAICLHCHGK
jgi:predicted CXXCH cytochrome family protein